jgi:bifunctional non-homologous end joining protein LigD
MHAPPRYRPMLAASGPILGEAGDYAFEPKMDGWRAIVRIGAAGLKVSTRNGHDVTPSVPELHALSETVAGRTVVLDGELVAHKGTPSSFYRLSGRMAARRPVAVDTARRRTPATFVAFDVLWLDGDVTGAPYRERRAMLEALHLQGPAWCTVSAFEGAGAEVFAACTALGLEGLVAKRLDSRYEPGVRSKAWVKAKCADWLHGHAQHHHGKR